MKIDYEGDRSSSPRPVWVAAATVLLAMVVLSLYVALAQVWDSRGVFEQHDVLFDADVKTRLDCFANGWDGDCRNTKHPNLANLINPPIRLAATLFVGAQDRLQFRRSLALCVAPLAASISVALCFVAALRMGTSVPRAMAVALALAASFSQVLFGSVPDHLALGGLTVALACSAYVSAMAGKPGSTGLWYLLGWFAASITITNAVPVALFYGSSLIAARESWSKAVGKAGLFVSFSLAAAFGSALLLNMGYGVYGIDVLMPHHGAGPLKALPIQNLIEFPLHVLQSFAPSEYRVVPNGMSLSEPHQYEISFALDSLLPWQGGHALPGMLLALLMVAALFRAWRKDRPAKEFAVTMCLAVLFHGVLHARVGADYFLYSAHWVFPTALLLADGRGSDVENRNRWHKSYTVALWIFALLLALNSADIVRSLVTDLDAYRGKPGLAVLGAKQTP